MDSLLKFLGQDPLVLEMVGHYVRCLIPMLFAVVAFQLLVRFLQMQSVVLLMPLLSFTTLLFFVPICWLLVYKSGAGFRGVAITQCPVSSFVCEILFNLHQDVDVMSREAFNDLSAFCKIAIPSTVMT